MALKITLAILFAASAAVSHAIPPQERDTGAIELAPRVLTSMTAYYDGHWSGASKFFNIETQTQCSRHSRLSVHGFWTYVSFWLTSVSQLD